MILVLTLHYQIQIVLEIEEMDTKERIVIGMIIVAVDQCETGEEIMTTGPATQIEWAKTEIENRTTIVEDEEMTIEDRFHPVIHLEGKETEIVDLETIVMQVEITVKEEIEVIDTRVKDLKMEAIVGHNQRAEINLCKDSNLLTSKYIHQWEANILVLVPVGCNCHIKQSP